MEIVQTDSRVRVLDAAEAMFSKRATLQSGFRILPMRFRFGI